MIYFIATKSDNAIKIGYTASDPLSRMASLQTGHHEKLRLIAVTEGEPSDEHRLHSIFADDQLYGEWFRPSEYLSATIEIMGEPAPSKDGRIRPCLNLEPHQKRERQREQQRQSDRKRTEKPGFRLAKNERDRKFWAKNYGEKRNASKRQRYREDADYRSREQARKRAWLAARES